MSTEQMPNVWFQTPATNWAIYEKTGPRTKQLWYILHYNDLYWAYFACKKTELSAKTISELKLLIVAEIDRRRANEEISTNTRFSTAYPGPTPRGQRSAQMTMRNKKVKVTLPSTPWDKLKEWSK